jgi:hypothetical protein
MAVETMDQYFDGVSELDVSRKRPCCVRCGVLHCLPGLTRGTRGWPFQIMFNIDKAHFILDEMICNGEIVETNKTRILAPVRVIDRVDKLA